MDDPKASNDAGMLARVRQLFGRMTGPAEPLSSADLTTSAWEAGSRLGPYELIGIVGTGGMGEVWKARDSRLDRIVAIKRLRAEHGQRFAQEARAVAALNHPHICQIHDVGDGYLVLEYIEGQPLRGPLSPDVAVRLALQIAAALTEAHGKGIIHRDLKPANVVVTPTGSAKLLDFGLAKQVLPSDADITYLTTEGTLSGTLAYMSPEQIDGRPLDGRSDVFSFGAVLYEMLTGTRAFQGGSAAQILTAVLRDTPTPPDAPRALVAVLARCLAKDAVDRFQTMAEVRGALERADVRASDPRPSIAVLPFANLSGDGEDDYFSDGLAEEIIHALAQLPGLRVTARTSAFAFRGRNQDIRTIADALDVQSILEGSVRRANGRLRVTAQLIKAAEGTHLWSERYKRDLADLFVLQDEIAASIADALKVTLAVAAPSPRRMPPSMPAYEAFLRGMHHWAKATPDAWKRSMDAFGQAIAIAPSFANAHSFLGGCFLTLAYAGVLPAREALPLARGAIERALALEPTLPEARAFLGMASAIQHFDWDDAGGQFRQAMAGATVSPAIHATFGYAYLLPIGRADEAVEQVEQALRTDPLNLPFRVFLTACLDAAGRDPIPALDAILELDDHFGLAHIELSIAYANRGILEEALASSATAHRLMPWNPTACGVRAALLAQSGDEAVATAILDAMRESHGYGVPRGLAWYHLLRDEIAQAAEWLEKAIEQRDPAVFILISGNGWQPASRQLVLARRVATAAAPVPSVPSNGVTGAGGATLARVLGVRQLAASIVNATVGAGIFLIPALASQVLGPAAPAAFVMCALAMALVVTSLAMAGSRVSATGGIYAYVHAAFGARVGFVTGTVQWLGCLVAVAGVSTALLDQLGTSMVFFTTPVVRISTLALILATLAAVNVRGVRVGARTIETLTLAKLFPLLLFVVIGVFAVQPRLLGWPGFPDVTAIGRASLVLIFAFQGIEVALTPSGEVRDPARTVPRAIYLALLLTTTLYIGIQLVAQGILGPALAQHTQAPLADAAAVVLGDGARTLMLVGALCSMFGYVSGDMLASPRTLFAFACEGFLPRVVQRIHPVHHTPSVAIWLHALLVFVVAASSTFQVLALIANVATLVLYLLACAAAIQLTRRDIQAGGVPFRPWGGVLVPILALTVIVWFLSSATWQEFAATGVVVMIALVVYPLRTKPAV